ncbi:peptidase [uncultured Aquimarina sp.]|uniref:peptidase n=1 Tax=uncultured Aquimarina sp. TaxID=575652 RepID=UPI0026265EDC|nr:peptidase [uncultured Aquimarina sp.]
MFNAEIKSAPDEDICILIKVDNHPFSYIIDCGEAKNLSVKECMNTNAIFISHTHIDHFVNFDTILRHQIGIQRKVVITGPIGIIDQVQNRIKSYCWNLIDKDAITYEIREILKDGEYKSAILRPPIWGKEEEKVVKSSVVFEEKQFVVEYEILDHKTDTIAYLFKAHDKTKIQLSDGLKGGKWVRELKDAYETTDEEMRIEIEGKIYKSKELFHLIHVEKGKKLGVILDHTANEENHSKIKRTFSGCDEVYIECFYKDEDKEFAEKNYHSYASKSGKIMKACDIENAIPVHFSRKYEEQDILELVEQFNKARK